MARYGALVAACLALTTTVAHAQLCAFRPGVGDCPPNSVKNYGAVGDGVTDDSAAFATALAAQCGANQTDGGTLFIPAGTYSLQSTWTIQKRANCRIVCEGDGSGQQTAGTRLEWDGANGGTVVLFDQTRDSTLEGCQIRAGAGTIGIGVRIDQVPTVTLVSTNITLRNLQIGAATTAGVQIGDQSTGGNDLHRLERVTIEGAGTAGVRIYDAQSKFIRIDGGSISGKTNGIQHVAGSFQAEGVNFASNTNDIALGTPTDVITVARCQSENATRFLYKAAASASPWAITLRGNRLSPDSAATTYLDFRERGPLLLDGNDFRAGGYDNDIRLNVQSTGEGLRVISLGNIFPNPTVWSVSSDVADIVSLHDVCLDSGGNEGPCTPLAPHSRLTTSRIGVLGRVPTAQTIAAGNTITADACGGVKRITAAGVVTTSTTDTFTAPAAANAGCAMTVCNVGANAITLDANTNFRTSGTDGATPGGDVVVGEFACVPVASDGTRWLQGAQMSENQ